MLNIAVAVLVALGTWWVTTSIILILDGLPRRTYPISMAGATALLAVALYGVSFIRNDTSSSGAYLGFGCGIAVWAWLEMSFLMGFVTGPRKHPCHLRGWRHCLHAIQAIAWHELAIIGAIALVWTLSRGGANTLAAQTLLVLWALRASAKLNLFLGVRNLSTELLPSGLEYLGSYFRKRPMNFLFPFSVAAGTLLAVHYATSGQVLLATLTGLGVLEHWLLVLPLPATALWSWGLRSHPPLPAPDSPAPCSPRSVV